MCSTPLPIRLIAPLSEDELKVYRLYAPQSFGGTLTNELEIRRYSCMVWQVVRDACARLLRSTIESLLTESSCRLLIIGEHVNHTKQIVSWLDPSKTTATRWTVCALDQLPTHEYPTTNSYTHCIRCFYSFDLKQSSCDWFPSRLGSSCRRILIADCRGFLSELSSLLSPSLSTISTGTSTTNTTTISTTTTSTTTTNK